MNESVTVRGPSNMQVTAKNANDPTGPHCVVLDVQGTPMVNGGQWLLLGPVAASALAGALMAFAEKHQAEARQRNG